MHGLCKLPCNSGYIMTKQCLMMLIFYTFSDLWENKPLLVKRHESNYYEGIFNTNEMDRILREVLNRLYNYRFILVL